MPYIFSQIMTLIAFIFLILVLFREDMDYLLYSFIALLIAGIPTAIEVPGATGIDIYIEAIDWNVIFFLIFMFVIVAILNEAKLFHEIARRIVKRFRNNIRAMFYMFCTVSTLSAAIIEDLSVAIIFIPIIIHACKEIEISPTPFLLGMTISINLASTLTPFGSAENIMIALYFDLDVIFFIKEFGLYFLFSFLLTLFLVDKLILTKTLRERWAGSCTDSDEIDGGHPEETPILPVDKIRNGILHPNKVSEKIKKITESFGALPGEYLVVSLKNFEIDASQIGKKKFYMNLTGFITFIFFLIFIHPLFIAGLFGVILFTFLNPIANKEGKKHPNVSYFLNKVDYKLLYFFICLFILVHLMELNGLIVRIEDLLRNTRIENIFLLSIVVLLVSSLFSGLIDNAPVTIMFMPVLSLLIGDIGPESAIPLLIAFVLGINLGGNFLPQGSAADMMTLELAQKNCVYDLTYKRLTKVGGLFAFFHIIIGIVYLAFVIYVF